MTACAITDHGTVAGLYEHYAHCKKKGIIPILGNELYWKEDVNTGFAWKDVENEVLRKEMKEADKARKYFHGCFYALNETGYKNLLKLSSIGFQPGHFQYNRPVVSKSEIFEYSEGLAYSTGCMIGSIGVAQPNPLTESESSRLVAEFKEIFGERMFIEIGPAQVCMDWDREIADFRRRPGGCLQLAHNHRAIKFSKDHGIPLVVASDGHMCKPSLKPVQDLIIRSSTSNRDGWHFYQTHAMLSSDETWQLIEKFHPYISESLYRSAIDSTFLLTSLAKDLKLSFSPKVPVFPVSSHPLYEPGMSKRELLVKIVLSNGRIPADPVYMERLRHEVSVLCGNGIIDLTDYFLVLEDVIRAAKAMDVPVGPGRGSAAGSLLAYALGITQVDPIRHGLLFERFLNEGRIGEPVISFSEYSFEQWVKDRG